MSMALNSLADEAPVAAVFVENQHSPGFETKALEDQLARIIVAARNVAVVAEELLRDVSHAQGKAMPEPHAISMAPRLLAATEQQLSSVATMLRKG